MYLCVYDVSVGISLYNVKSFQKQNKCAVNELMVGI